MKLRWHRPNSESGLYLQVWENGAWVFYKNAKHYSPDVPLSTNSGFATAQKYLSMGYKYESTADIEVASDRELV